MELWSKLIEPLYLVLRPIITDPTPIRHSYINPTSSRRQSDTHTSIRRRSDANPTLRRQSDANPTLRRKSDTPTSIRRRSDANPTLRRRSDVNPTVRHFRASLPYKSNKSIISHLSKNGMQTRPPILLTTGGLSCFYIRRIRNKYFDNPKCN